MLQFYTRYDRRTIDCKHRFFVILMHIFYSMFISILYLYCILFWNYRNISELSFMCRIYHFAGYIYSCTCPIYLWQPTPMPMIMNRVMMSHDF